MKKLFLFAAMFMFAATSCESEVNNPNNPDESGSRVTEDVMEQLINDLLSGVCTPCACEIMLGNECVKPWEQGILGDVGAKFSDYGLSKEIVFYNDGTCKMGYCVNVPCEKQKTDPTHADAFYDTWQWSYNRAEATITIIAEDLPESKGSKTTVKVVSYEDGILMIDGELPNYCLAPYTYKYKCRIDGVEARKEFEKYHRDENDYPCCCKI